MFIQIQQKLKNQGPKLRILQLLVKIIKNRSILVDVKKGRISSWSIIENNIF